MATQHTAVTAPDVPAAPANIGGFPFPLTDGPAESRQLTWLRNHSNYMAVRGIFDYLRSVGVLVRGVIVNFLTFLPYLLVIAIGLGYLHHWMLKHPYVITLWVIVFSVAWVLLFPVAMPIYKIWTHGKSLGAKSKSSFSVRDWYERSFSTLLLVIFAAAVFESLPHVLEFSLDQIQAGKLGWRASLASVVAALALFGGSDKLLSVLSGAKKTLATILVGLFGLLVPLLVILYATNFLLYSPPPTPWVMLSPLLAAALYVVAIFCVIGVGVFRKSFTGKELAVIFGLLFGAMALAGCLTSGTVLRMTTVHPHDTALNKIIAPMQHIGAYFEDITNKQALAPAVAAFVDEAVKVEHETRRTREDIRSQAESECFQRRYSSTLREKLDCADKIAQWEATRYSTAAKYIELEDKLSSIPDTHLDPLRGDIGKLARAKLWSLLKAREDDKDCGYYGSCKDGELVQRIRRMLIFRQLPPVPSDGSGGTILPPEKIASICRLFDTDELAAAKNVCEVFAASYTTKRHNDAIEQAITTAQGLLSRVPNEELAELISESELYFHVNDKFKRANLFGQADIARLTGKEAMARLLTRQELLCSIFYNHRHCRFVTDGDEAADGAGQSAETSLDFRPDFNRATKWMFTQAALPKLPKPLSSLETALDIAELPPPGAGGRTPRATPGGSGQSQLPDLHALARLASWKLWRPPELPEGLRTPWKKPTESEMKWWSDDALLHPEYLARVAGEYLFGAVMGSMSTRQIELMLKRLIVDWDKVDYDPQRKDDKDFVERLYILPEKWPGLPELADLPLEDLVCQVTPRGMKKLQALIAAENGGKGVVECREDLRSAQPEKAGWSQKELLTQAAALLKGPLQALGVVQADDLFHVELVMELARRIHIHPERLKERARGELIRQALQINTRSRPDSNADPRAALEHLKEFQLRRIDTSKGRFLELMPYAEDLPSGVLSTLAVTKFLNRTSSEIDAIDKLITATVLGKHGGLERPDEALKKKLTAVTIHNKALFVALLAAVIWLGCWFAVDVNLTSIHGLYRDRLASAFLVGDDTKGDINPEKGIDLSDICHYEARSIAPYHLINVALNLQGSDDKNLRDRNSDFFMFSKRFIGGRRTGYCRSETMEQVFPQLDLATAMAVSAAAASPNMGRGTSPLLVAFMTMLNIRLGFWLPNPGLLEEQLSKSWWQRLTGRMRWEKTPPGFTFEEVFAQELQEIERRWGQVYPDVALRRQLGKPTKESLLKAGGSTPTVDNNLVGIGFSGGGIRSAAINLGIVQTLQKCGAFDHVDYMSTVSGGGYLGSSISAQMRTRESLVNGIAGKVTRLSEDVTPPPGGKTVVVSGAGGEQTFRFAQDAELAVTPGAEVKAGQPMLKDWSGKCRSDIAGVVEVSSAGDGTGSIVTIRDAGVRREYRFSRFDDIRVKTGDRVKPGQVLVRTHHSVGERFLWRVRPSAFLREMSSRLDETHRWVNLSDGGHIENLAAVELLRRRCKYIIIGDGEADPKLHFNGLATLLRCAYIDLGIQIDIKLDGIRLTQAEVDAESATLSGEHWAVGTITYPSRNAQEKPETGYLLYLKSSFTGDEDVSIMEYRQRNPAFPHQKTSDQFFDEGQFEAYRALGEHIAENALRLNSAMTPNPLRSFAAFVEWFEALKKTATPAAAPTGQG